MWSLLASAWKALPKRTALLLIGSFVAASILGGTFLYADRAYPHGHGDMGEVQQVLGQLKAKGWTLAAISDAIEVHRDSVAGWDAGRHSPANAKAVTLLLEGLLRRQRIPKKRRYK